MDIRGSVNRRSVLRVGALAVGVAVSPGAAPAIRKGRIRQSIAYWCLNAAPWSWDIERICRLARELGCESVELVAPQHWAALRKSGIHCAIAPNGMSGPPFVKGLNNPRYHEEVIARTRQTMEQCADFGVPNVIGFTGYKWRDANDPASGEISLEEGADNCVKALGELAGLAEKVNVTVCLEQLNTRDDTHPMKGHPGYQGDNIDYCAEIVRRVGSPRVKLLFDIYHVQIMNGDVIRRIHAYKDLLGHIHTAGNPGRAELDDQQEIYYPAIMRALLDIGYQGFVGQEFIPTRDPEQALAEAVTTCDV